MALLIPLITAVLLGACEAGDEIAKRASTGLNPPPYRFQGPYLVSFIIPTRHEEEWLPSCLQCIVNQTYQPIETIIADYQSLDRTREVAMRYGAKVISVERRGIGVARDLGALNSSGEILIFCDADCIFESQFVEKVVEALEGTDIVTYQYAFYDGNIVSQAIWTVHTRTKDPSIVEGFAIATWRCVYDRVGPFKLETGEHWYWRTKAKMMGFRFKKLDGIGFATSCRRYYGEGRAPGWNRECVEELIKEEFLEK